MTGRQNPEPAGSSPDNAARDDLLQKQNAIAELNRQLADGEISTTDYNSMINVLSN